MYFCFFTSLSKVVFCAINPNIPVFANKESFGVLSSQHFKTDLYTNLDIKNQIDFPIGRKNDFESISLNEEIIEDINIPINNEDKKIFRLWAYKNNYGPSNILSESEMKELFLKSLAEFDLYNFSIFQAKNEKLKNQNITEQNDNIKKLSIDTGNILLDEDLPLKYDDEFPLLDDKNVIKNKAKGSKNGSKEKKFVKTKFIDLYTTKIMFSISHNECQTKKRIKFVKYNEIDIINDCKKDNTNKEKVEILDKKYTFTCKDMQISNEKEKKWCDKKFNVTIFYASKKSKMIRLDVNDKDILICKTAKIIYFFCADDGTYFHCLFFNDFQERCENSYHKLNEKIKLSPGDFINNFSRNFISIFEKKNKKNRKEPISEIEVIIIITFMNNNLEDKTVYKTKTKNRFIANLTKTKTEISSVLCKIFNLKNIEVENIDDRYSYYFFENTSNRSFNIFTKNSHWIYDRFCLLEISGNII